MSLFINHTNHPSARWGTEQLEAARKYGEVQDQPFPAIDPHLSEAEVLEIALAQSEKIINLQPAAVLCQGEYTYTFALVNLLKKHNITVLTACSERVAVETVVNGSTKRESSFRFVRFRRY